MAIVYDFASSLSGVTVHRASGGGRIKADGTYEWDSTHNTARLDHDLDGTFLGLLVEPERTNYWPLSGTMHFSGTEVNTAGGDGACSVVANNAVGVDGAMSAHTVDMSQTNARYWYDGTPWASEWVVASQYVKRNGDAADLGYGFLINGTQHQTKFTTPATGFARLENTSPSRTGSSHTATTIYMANRRDHPDGAGGGPSSLIVWGHQIELINGAERVASSYIPAGTTRSKEIVELAVANGRYHVRVVGAKGSYIWPDVEIAEGKWYLDVNPSDFHVKSVEFLNVETTTSIDGVPIVVKTVGRGATDYADLAAVKAAMPASLVAADEIWWIKVLPGSYVESGTTTFNATTDARHPLWLSSTDYGYAAKNNKQNWWGTRHRTRISRGTGTAVQVGTDYMSVWGLALDGLLMSATTAPGDPLGGFLLARDCPLDGGVRQADNGGPYTRLTNCPIQGFQYQGIVRASSDLSLVMFNCSALAAAVKETSATSDGLSGTLYNTVAFNYENTAGLGGKLYYCATDASDGSAPGLSNLSYATTFENAFADPTLAVGSALVGAGEFRAEAQCDIRGTLRPISGGVDIGVAETSAAVDLTLSQLAAGAKAGKAQPIGRNLASTVFSWNPMWDGTGGAAAKSAFDGGWRSYTVVPKTGAPMIAGSGGGHGETGMDAAQYVFNRSGDLKWERILHDPEVQVRYKDDSRPPVRRNPAAPGYPDSLSVGTDTDWIDEAGVPLNGHYYGGPGGNGAVSDDLSYMVMIGSSWFSTGGGYAYGNKLSIIDLATGYWDTARSGANGEDHGGTSNGGKAFVETGVGKRIQWFISSQSRKVLKYDLTAPAGTGLQTGSGMDPGVWHVDPTSQTGLDGGACYAPSVSKALAWQSSSQGAPYSWIDTSSDIPVFTAFTPTGDLPPDGALFGAVGVWHETDAAIYLYTGSDIYRFDPVTEVFEKKTKDQTGAGLEAFPNLSSGISASPPILGYLPDEDVLMVGGQSGDDVYLFDPTAEAATSETINLTPAVITAEGGDLLVIELITEVIDLTPGIITVEGGELVAEAGAEIISLSPAIITVQGGLLQIEGDIQLSKPVAPSRLLVRPLLRVGIDWKI